MGFTHLRGSLAQNISDITKGGGCPAIKPPNKNMSVLRYFSRFKDNYFSVPFSVVGDGGYINDSGESFQEIPRVFYYSQAYFLSPDIFYRNLNLNDTFPHNSSTFVGDNNAINICNRRELLSGSSDDYINDSGDNIIQNIELANDVIEKDESGFYNYNLYKKSHTMNIVLAGTESPVSKTAELMEFVYLHALIPRCKSGELYLEIEDFELTGTITNDYLIYCYYWETPRDKRSIADAFGNDDDLLSANPNLLLTDKSISCIKTFRLSDIQSQGADKKLIIWLDKLKTKSELFAVNILIGMNAQELRRDESYNDEVISYDECSDLIFKFKKSSIKIRRFSDEIRNSPITYPGYGYKNLIDVELPTQPDYITITTHALDSSGNAVSINTQSGIVGFGVPGGGASPVVEAWQDYVTLNVGYDSNYLNLRTVSGVIDRFTICRFFKTNQILNDDQTYILKLPSLSNLVAWNIDVSGGSYTVDIPPPTEFYYNIFGEHSTDYVFKIYCGEYPTQVEGQYPNYRDFIDDLVLLHTFTAAEIAGGVKDPNSGMEYEDQYGPIIGTPYFGANEAFAKKNMYKYVEFLGSAVNGFASKNFFVSLELASQPIKTISYSAVGDGDPPPDTFYFPSGVLILEPQPVEDCVCAVIAEYVRAIYLEDSRTTLCRNNHAMIFQAPQIINKNETPQPENYLNS